MKSLLSRFIAVPAPKSLRFLSSSTPLRFFSNCRDASTEPSAAYLCSMLRFPPTLKRWSIPHKNSCSFIGTVIRPVKRYSGPTTTTTSSSYTILEVKTKSAPFCGSVPGPSPSSSSFRILLAMRNRLSEISLRHLKPNDYIYVSGNLCSFDKVNASGNREIFYKVFVSELNFVKRTGTSQISQEPESATVGTPCEYDQERVASDDEERSKDRLRLWQVFFANPHEWWDNRQGKRNLRSPDFKHKDTKECLWLHSDDPSWVKKQLQLHDSSMERLPESRNNISEWKLKDFV